MAKTERCIDWSAGAGAQLDSGGTAGGGNYRLRYIPPFRATIRPPLATLQFGDRELRNLLVDLDELAQMVTGVAARGVSDPVKADMVIGRDRKAEQAGQILFDSVIPRYVAADLRAPRLFVDFGVDEALVNYPWELMHDGEDYLCLKHYLGRFVNSRIAQFGHFQAPASSIGQSVDKLSILVISVPRPDQRVNVGATAGGTLPPLKNLPGAEQETAKILEILAGIEGVEVKLLAKQDATYGNVYNALKTGHHHIVHYVGHAVFNNERPNWSALVLKDRDMTTGNICNFFGAHPPLLCFVNACDSGRTEGWSQNYNIFGLAQAFLATGSYLIGSRWNLDDEPAVGFAAEFYQQLVNGGAPIGQALMEARKKTRDKWRENFAWASYVYYGDPRVYFRGTIRVD